MKDLIGAFRSGPDSRMSATLAHLLSAVGVALLAKETASVARLVFNVLPCVNVKVVAQAMTVTSDEFYHDMMFVKQTHYECNCKNDTYDILYSSVSW